MPAITGRVAKKIRVLVAERSLIHTQLLSDVLRRDPDLEVIDWEWDPTTLVPFVQTHQIDVLAISSALSDQDTTALELLRELHSAHPETRAVVLLDSQNDEDVINAFRAGARGIFGPESPAEMFCKCIHRVHEGEIWADKRGIALVVGALAAAPVVRAARADGMSLLSKREDEVVRCVVQGMTNQEIADHMGLSRHTIKNYLFRIFDKLGVSSRVELLFMTLNQTGREEKFSLPQPHAGPGQFPLTPCDEATFAVLEEAAEKGTPAAQLALAQAYLERQTGPDDLIYSYMWYLIATERTWQGEMHFTKMLTSKQIEEAQKQATLRLARMKQPADAPPNSAAAESLPMSRVI